MQRRWIYAPESYPLDVLAAMALFRGKSGCEVTSDSVLSGREETLEVSIHAPLRLARNTTPSSVARVRICALIRRDNRLAVPIATLNYSRCRLRIWAWRYRNFGGRGKNWAAPVAPVRLHSSSIPELSCNQRCAS